MALSEARREARRQRLIAFAQALIRENAGAGFSMAQLAQRAGVSPATPYNLIGPKSEVLRLVVRAEFDGFVHRLDDLDGKAGLVRLRTAAERVSTHYLADRAFYLGLYRASSGVEGAELYGLMQSEGRSLWSSLIAAACESGELGPLARAQTFTDTLLRTISAVTQAWLTESWCGPRFTLELRHACDLLFCAVAAPRSSAFLAAELERTQAELQALAPPGPDVAAA